MSKLNNLFLLKRNFSRPRFPPDYFHALFPHSLWTYRIILLTFTLTYLWSHILCYDLTFKVFLNFKRIKVDGELIDQTLLGILKQILWRCGLHLNQQVANRIKYIHTYTDEELHKWCIQYRNKINNTTYKHCRSVIMNDVYRVSRI